MRLVVSLLTTVCFIAAAEAGATGLATPTPKPRIIDQIKQPSLLGKKRAGGMCQTQRQWIDGRQFCNTYCF